ncbi:uncharacterized protein LOC101851016 [Aplysia californica]|uniref:Uncharacterized protein LOC101851016 n=1 Tax=Aplysia californica TaxID=6500 RepID=A0ABM0ZU76_APLCA|nr:uncharacterized protein LOC101851016 [Aplysia californica]
MRLLKNFSFRRARLSDYYAVTQKLRIVRNDWDYLPGVYNEFVASPGRMGFVALNGNSEIVGAHFGIIVDNGQTLCKRAARVKENLQGQGIFTRLSEVMDEEVRRHGMIKWEVKTCAWANAERVRNGYIQRANFKELYAMESYDMYLKVSDILPVRETSFSNIRPMTHQDLWNIFNDEGICEKFFPRGRVPSFWVPLRPVEDNLKHLINCRTHIFMSCKSHAKFDPDSKPLGTIKASDISMMSLLFCYTTESGFVYNTDLHGQDFSDLESHLKFHLHRLQNVGHESVRWTIMFDSSHKDVIEERIGHCLKEYGVSLTQKVKSKQDVYFEKML